jgi:hypothetical protein
VREDVVQVLGRPAHHRRALVDQPLGDEARVEVHLLAHGVMAHVLHAARDDDVAGAHRDLAGAGGDRRERAGAHPVDREAGDGVRQAGEQRDLAAERQPLVAHLRGRGDHDVADSLRRHGGIAAEQLAHELHRHVVGPRPPEDALGACTAERGADAVDVDHVASHRGRG